ncbi:MAG: hypothetical protein MZV65_33620 [Chromatiales bacterium]|nr:hypothetical protein [Chromatiales bacterium]
MRHRRRPAHRSAHCRFLRAVGADASPARVVLVSTSGVYGDCRGEWVDEDRACRAPMPTVPTADSMPRRTLRRWAGHACGAGRDPARARASTARGGLPVRARWRAACRCCARTSRRGATACTSTTWRAPVAPGARPAMGRRRLQCQ